MANPVIILTSWCNEWPQPTSVRVLLQILTSAVTVARKHKITSNAWQSSLPMSKTWWHVISYSRCFYHAVLKGLEGRLGQLLPSIATFSSCRICLGGHGKDTLQQTPSCELLLLEGWYHNRDWHRDTVTQFINNSTGSTRFLMVWAPLTNKALWWMHFDEIWWNHVQ